MAIASTIAIAAMGADIVSARIIRELAKERGGAAEATLWFDGDALPVADAARVNAAMSDAATSDDSDLRSIAHIGTIVARTAIGWPSVPAPAAATCSLRWCATVTITLKDGRRFSDHVDFPVLRARIAQRGFELMRERPAVDYLRAALT